MLGTTITKDGLNLEIGKNEWVDNGYSVTVRHQAIEFEPTWRKALQLKGWTEFDGWLKQDGDEYATFHVDQVGVTITEGCIYITGEILSDAEDAILDGTSTQEELGLSNMLEVAQIVRQLLN